jgi:hypothetical protein
MQLLPELGDVFVLEASSFRLGFHHKLDLAEVGVQHLKKKIVNTIYFKKSYLFILILLDQKPNNWTIANIWELYFLFLVSHGLW